MTKNHSTNYANTFISCADDTTAVTGQVPPTKQPPSLASLQFWLISPHPYRYTSDECIFECYLFKRGFVAMQLTAYQLAEAQHLDEDEYASLCEQFFSKGQPCLRSSPLSKMYGWGSHFDSQGRVAMYGKGTAEYQKFCQDPEIQQLKAMRSKRV